MTAEEPTPLEIQTDVMEGGATIVSVAGEIDMATAPQFELGLAAPIERGAPIIVDLGKVSFMDSSGLRVLHRAAANAQVILVLPQDSILDRTVRIAGLEEIVPIYTDVDAAKAQIETT